MNIRNPLYVSEMDARPSSPLKPTCAAASSRMSNSVFPPVSDGFSTRLPVPMRLEALCACDVEQVLFACVRGIFYEQDLCWGVNPSTK